jgi:hypothetical protein
MVSSFIKMNEPTTTADNAWVGYAPSVGEMHVNDTKKLFTYFIHREDSEPDRVASRNRLAPTQPLPSSTSAQTRPTEFDADCSFRSEPISLARSMVTVVAIHCDFTSRSANVLGDFQRRRQPGGRQTDGFRRTIGYEKNQLGVREYLT